LNISDSKNIMGVPMPCYLHNGEKLMDELIDYTTIARLLRDIGIPGDRVRYLIRMLTMPNRQLVRLVQDWAMDAAIESERLSDEQLTAFRSALGNPSMSLNVPK
jgi:hypothetical protein